MKNIGEILVEKGVLNQEAIDVAIEDQKRRLGELLVSTNKIQRADLVEALKEQMVQGSVSDVKMIVSFKELERILFQLTESEHWLRGQKVDPFVGNKISNLRSNIEQHLVEPVQGLFKQARRVLMAAAHDSKKMIRFESSGDDLIIDRLTIDELSHAIPHLVRNAVEHGIESSDIRISSGKDPSGVLRLTAERDGSNIILKIFDDGAGIDCKKVVKKALEKGIHLNVSEDSATLSEIKQILFSPNFSTRDQTSHLSGRGVGLDVVEATLSRVSGSIDVQSIVGFGTTFEIKMPLKHFSATVIPYRTADGWFGTLSDRLPVSVLERGVPEKCLIHTHKGLDARLIGTCTFSFGETAIIVS